MRVILMETRCRDCGIKLTQFELEEKKGYCMDCSKEKEVPSSTAKFSLLDWKKKRAANS